VNFVLGGVLLLSAVGMLAVPVASLGLRPITGYLIAVAALIAVLLPTAILHRPVSWRPVRLLLLVGIPLFNVFVLSWVLWFSGILRGLDTGEGGALILANWLLAFASPAAALGGATRPPDSSPDSSPDS
jgi:hypothetical protein